MLDRLSGKILHIDFGDCFEVREYFLTVHYPQIILYLSETEFHHNPQQVAMTREKFPEKIPFRLTRMLTNAMEVCNCAESYPVINTYKCVY